MHRLLFLAWLVSILIVIPSLCKGDDTYDLEFAIRKCEIEKVRQFIKNGVIAEKGNTLDRPLEIVGAMVKPPDDAHCGEVVRLLIESKVDPNGNVKGKGQGPLTNAIILGKHPDVVRELIRGGANVNLKDVNDWTPLMWAADSSHDKSVQRARLLIEAKADVNVRNKEGNTALLIEARSIAKPSDVEMIRLFIKTGADVNVKNNEGNTALMVTVDSADDTEPVKVLIYEGKADLTLRNNDGETALMIAKGKSFLRKQVAATLEKAGAKE